MSRAAIRALSDGAAFDARLERAPAPRPGALDGWLAALAGRCNLHLLRIGAPWRRRWGRQTLARALALQGQDEVALSQHWQDLRTRLRREGPHGPALADGLAAVAEVARRTLGQQPHGVQLLAARALVQGRIVEMATGEGKSLTAALAAGVLAASGVPVHVYTVNDYLARRDAQAMRPLFDWLGLRVAALDGAPGSPGRRDAYAVDVLYLVNKDGVFDYLRQRLGDAHGPFAGRGMFHAIVDEADSILIDEARTPLVLARAREDSGRDGADALLALAQTLVPQQHFQLLQRERRAELLPAGRQRLLAWQDAAPLRRPPSWREEQLLQALCALHLFVRDRDYVVLDGKVQIIDEFTGRILHDRTWQRGLHQFIERKEGLAPSAPRQTLASLTYPQFYARYLRLSGMSGTVAEVAGELRRAYGAQVVRVPTHRPVRRVYEGPCLLADSEARWSAVVAAVQAGVTAGRAVLVGTRSVQASEALAARLVAAGLAPVVLNARQDADEAAIVAAAGASGQVTVATNMAGRGTDIRIDDRVRAAGGLQVVLTEFHDTARVDRQLYGRCARQGDPGLALALASLEDDLFVKHLHPMVGAAARHVARRMARGRPAAQALPRWLARFLLFWAQRRAEAHLGDLRAVGQAQDAALRDQLGFLGDRS